MIDWWAHYLPEPDGTEPYPNAPTPDLDQLDMVQAVLTDRPSGYRAVARRLGWPGHSARYWLGELEKAGRAQRVRVFGWTSMTPSARQSPTYTERALPCGRPSARGSAALGGARD